jgi:hypothetical protein
MAILFGLCTPAAGMMTSDSFNTRYLVSRILKASGILIARDPLLDRKSAEVAAMAIDPYLREGAFLPEATAAMAEAFEAVCNELHLADESKELRTLVATRIIAAARQGEIDPVRLRMKGLVGFSSAIPALTDPSRNTVLRQRARIIKRHDGEPKPEPKSPTAGDVKSWSAA